MTTCCILSKRSTARCISKALPLFAQWGVDVRNATAASGGAKAYKLITGHVCESKPPSKGKGKDGPTSSVCDVGAPRFVGGALHCECLDCGEHGCLFDVLSDPGETRNLAAILPEVRASLHEQLVAARTSSAARRDEWQSGIAEIEGCPTCGKCKAVFADFAARNGHVIQPLVQD